MHETVRSHILARLGGAEPDGLDLVIALFRERHARRGETLLAAGAVCRHVYFVVEGCVQIFLPATDNDGAEATRDLCLAGSWVTVLPSFMEATPAAEGLRAAVPTALLSLDRGSFDALLRDVPAFGAVYLQVLEKVFSETIARTNAVSALDAAGRVRWVMAERPELLQRLPARLVADYLRIAPETLSRVRKSV